MTEENYYTIFHDNRAIPMDSLKNKNKETTSNSIGMATNGEREGIHMWIGHHRNPTKEEIKSKMYQKEDRVFVNESVHLTREDARNLIKEIKERLF